MTDSFMPQIENIVFLMLENRSLDNLLGWLYTPTPNWPCPSQPQNVCPPGSPKNYDGLVKGKYSNPDLNGNELPITPISDDVWNSGEAIPHIDPYEALRSNFSEDPRGPLFGWKGVMNQFFGNQNTISGLPSESIGTPAMKGFFQDYSDAGDDILWTYTPTQANVINSIALQYGVSDRWFCSVPSDTNPNRAYSLCGTSQGRESNLHWSAIEQFEHTTIFNAISQTKDWGIYYSDFWKYGNVSKRNLSYTEYTFPYITDAHNGKAYSISDFYDQAKHGTLPAFSYIEPHWTSLFPTTSDGTDYHPNAHINPGEKFLHDIYQHLRQSPQWEKMLFIITFDEHGGTYDHVSPPWGALNPDDKNGQENGFKFNLFGARVPTILVSPFIPQNTVFRAPEEDIKNNKYPFDHTSFIKTILKWAGTYDEQAGYFGKRMQQAQTFEQVLANHKVNDGNVKFNALPEITPNKRHLATDTTEEIGSLLKEMPVAPARTIHDMFKTVEEVQTAIEHYHRDPGGFDSWIEQHKMST